MAGYFASISCSGGENYSHCNGFPNKETGRVGYSFSCSPRRNFPDVRTGALLRDRAKPCKYNARREERNNVHLDGTTLAVHSRRAVWLLEDLVKTKIQSLSFLATLAVVLGLISWGSTLHAQTAPSTPTDQQAQPTPTPDTPPTQQTQQPTPTPSPDTPPAAQQPPAAQTPDQSQAPSDNSPSAAAPSASDGQTFSGTVVKSGDKYVLKTDSGKTYDIDHQDEVKKFDGKRVRVKGKLDDTGTKIQVQ
jgi:hypothetical protein